LTLCSPLTRLWCHATSSFSFLTRVTGQDVFVF
jgi:hypothetical protein